MKGVSTKSIFELSDDDTRQILIFPPTGSADVIFDQTCTTQTELFPSFPLQFNYNNCKSLTI